VFDIIAGTSIGAVNASIIINEVLEKKKQEKLDEILKYWENTPEKLIQFWITVSKSNAITDLWDPWNIPDFYRSFIENYLNLNYETYLNTFPFLRSVLPSEESFRKYYHTQLVLASGEKQIFRPKFIYPFPSVWNKFFDPISPTARWFQYSNLPLRNSIAGSASMLNDNDGNGIKTQYSEKEPRLLLVAVDIGAGDSRTFDSYYENITIKHVLASAAVPKHYAYIDIGGKKYWDGGILSNTPVREVLSEHSKFWVEGLGLDLGRSPKIDFEKGKESFKKDNKDEQNKNKNKKIPKLDLCIVNLYPSKETGQQIPSLYDYDLTIDRENDIRYRDKTDYDLKLAKVVTDYHDFVERLGEVAIEAIEGVKDKKIVDELKSKFTKILNEKQRTPRRDKTKPDRYYYELLRNRFDIETTIKIERQDDIDTIANKAFDFSPETISSLIEHGIYDTLNTIYVHHEKWVNEWDKKSFPDWLKMYTKEIKKLNLECNLETVQQFAADFNIKFSEGTNY
jgi:NTE family protein